MMKKAVLICSLILIASLTTALAQPPIIEWQRSLGGSNDDIAYSIQQTTDGGYIVAGGSNSNNGDINQNHGSFDFWIVKLDDSGMIQWEKSLGDANAQTANDIRQTADGGFIVAGYAIEYGSPRGWVVKLDSNGEVLWDKLLPGNITLINSIRPTTDGGYILAGTSLKEGQTFPLPDYCILKLDDTGAIQWQRSFGGERFDVAYAAQQTTDGGYITAGYVTMIDESMGIWESTDYWIVKLDSAGATEWQRSYGGSRDDVAYFIQQTSDNGYIAVGHTNSDDGDVSGLHSINDIWVIKLDESGTMQWQKCLGGSGVDKASSIQQTTDGGYIIAGSTGSNDGDVTLRYGGYDFWIVKLDGEGDLQWQKCFGGSGLDEAHSIEQIAEDSYIVAGSSSSNDIDVSGNRGRVDFWVIKLVPATDVDTTDTVDNYITNVSLTEAFHIYPNPASHEIVINNIPENATLSITDISGRIIYQRSPLGKQEKVNVGNCANGIYFVRITFSSGSISGKFVVYK